MRIRKGSVSKCGCVAGAPECVRFWMQSALTGWVRQINRAMRCALLLVRGSADLFGLSHIKLGLGRH
jgi:hypothetical protein